MLGDDELIVKMLDDMELSRKQIADNIAELSFLVENGTTFQEWWAMSYDDRARFVHLINEKIKARTGKEYF